MFKKVDKLLIITAIIVIMLGISLVFVNFVNIKINAKSSEQMNVSYSTTESNTWDVSKAGNESVIAILSEDGTLTISGTGEMKDFNNSPITEWHEMKESIKNAIIENGVTRIGNSAFSGCTSLQSIEISSSLTSIGWYAFSGCTSLTSIEIPSSVTKIEGSALGGCSSLTRIEIPDSVTSIGTYVFSGCTSLTSIQISENVTSIRTGTFNGCSSLMSIKIPSGVTSVDDYAFDRCSNLTSIDVDESNTAYMDDQGVLYTKDGTNIIKYPEGKNGTEYTILDTVTIVGNRAFKDCSRLKSIVIPDNVTIIGEYAFEWCSGLTNIIIPDSVRSIGDDAFFWCSRLTNIEIPDSVTSIGDSAFYGCSSLMSIKTPGRLTSIGERTFSSCSSLRSIEIPDSVRSIGDNAFDGCSGLRSIEIPDSVTSVGDNAFEGCINLMEFSIPENIDSIGENVFSGCNITNFIMEDNNFIAVPAILKRALDETDILYSSQEFIFTNCTMKDAKIKINDGATYATLEVIDGKLKGLTYTISYNAWDISENGDESLKATLDKNGLFLISGLGNMKDYASVQDTPWYCINNLIAVIKIEIGVTSVNLYAFNTCSYLTNIEISSSVMNLGEEKYYILYGCTRLSNIIVNSSNTKYCDDNGVLYTKDKEELIKYPIRKTEEKYKILTGTKIIRNVAFADCGYLKSIEMPCTVREIGNYAFDHCLYLKNVIIPEGVTTIGEGAFYCCIGLGENIFPKSVTQIGRDTFYRCDELKILCYKDSYVETYAKENEIEYSIIYLTSTEQTIDEQNLVIKGIKPETTIEKLKITLQSDIPYEILDNSGNVIENTSVFVATGYQLKLSNNQKYIIVVKGDINGDGNAKLSDLSKLKLSVIGTTQLEGAYKEAADLNGDGNVKLSDLSKMKLYLVGKGSL